MLMANGGVGNPPGLPVRMVSRETTKIALGPLVKDVVPEKSINDMAHGDGQRRAGYVESSHPQLARTHIIVPVV